MRLTVQEFDVLDIAIDYRDRLDWAITTTRSLPRARVKRLVARGLLRELDEPIVLMNPETGFSYERERYRTGYEPTDAGRAAHAAFVAEEKEAGARRRA